MDEIGESIVALLCDHHRRIETLLSKLEFVGDDHLGKYLKRVCSQVEPHGAAEKLVFYSACRKVVPNGEAIADAYCTENSQVDELLGELKASDRSPRALRYRLEDLRGAVLAHARHEERDPFPLLEAHASKRDLTELGRSYKEVLRELTVGVSMGMTSGPRTPSFHQGEPLRDHVRLPSLVSTRGRSGI